MTFLQRMAPSPALSLCSQLSTGRCPLTGKASRKTQCLLLMAPPTRYSYLIMIGLLYIAGQGQPENPVPAADGTTYQVFLVSLQTCIFYHHVYVIEVLTYQVCLFSCGRPVVHGKLQGLLA